MIRILLCTVIMNLALTMIIAQSNVLEKLPTFKISIVSEHHLDQPSISNFEKNLRHEIEALLVNKKQVQFESKYCNCQSAELSNLINQVFADNTVDAIVGVGPLASALLANRNNYPKPTIASLIINQKLQNVPLSTNGSSGVKNFNYIQSPYSFEKDLQLLHDIIPFQNIGIIVPSSNPQLISKFEPLFSDISRQLNSKFSFVATQSSVASTVELIPTEIDAIYLLPLFNDFTENQYSELFEALSNRNLPSVALLGESMVAKGAMLAYQTDVNLSKIPRRIAMSLYRISQGVDASTLPVQINTYTQNTVINMQTVRKVGVYPSWDMMTASKLLYADKVETDRNLKLQSAIMESLKQNLDLKIAQANPLIAKKDVQLAGSEWLPQADLNSSIYLLDSNSSDNTFGARGRTNWDAGASLSQLVYAEPALANIAIQKYLEKGAEAGMLSTQLDIILETVEAYLHVLQAKSYTKIQAANISVTKSNLDISQAKDAVGYSGASDLNRWISEMAIAKIDLNDAQTQFRLAKYALNQKLNQPISAEFNLEDISLEDKLLLATDDRLTSKIKNEKDLSTLADFFVLEALNNLPELKEIRCFLGAQNRLLTSQKRAFYLPSFAVSGDLNYNIKKWDVKEVPVIGIPDSEPSWNLGLGLKFPILQGNSKRYNVQKTEINIVQLKDQFSNAKNQLELRVRADLQEAVASFFEVQRFKEANKGASDNFIIVQDAYSQGVTSITNLIDAQNAKIQTELGLANANYQFILDFFEVERAIGHYYNLKTPAAQEAFFERLEVFMTQ